MYRQIVRYFEVELKIEFIEKTTAFEPQSSLKTKQKPNKNIVESF